MPLHFQDAVKSKSKDELVRIVIHKDEYKEELVSAAVEELKLREGTTTRSGPNNTVIVITNPEKKSRPFGLYLAGALFLLLSPYIFVFGVMQAGASAIVDDSDAGVYAIWNILCSVVFLVIGIGIMKAEKWGYEWGIGTAILNSVWFGYLYATWETKLPLFMLLTQVAIAIALFASKGFFVRVDDNFVDSQPDENIDDYGQKIRELYRLIQSEKNSFFGSADAEKIKQLTLTLCTSRKDSEFLLRIYSETFRKDLVEEFKKLTNNYNNLKEYLYVFIEHGIISKEFPHDRLMS